MSQPHSPKFIKYFSRIILCTAIIVVVLIYFLNSNTLVSFGNESSQIKKEIKEIEKQNQDLMSQIATQDILNNIKEDALAFKMETAQEAKYIKVSDVSVVMREIKKLRN